MNIEEPLTKELAQKFMAMKGECRGMTIKTDWAAILQTKGKESLAKLEAKMAELGYPLKYQDIKETNFYPIGYDAVSLLAMKDALGFTEEDFFELGATAIKFSVLIKIVVKYFMSLKLIAEQVSEMWGKHYTTGNMQVADFNEKERYTVLQLKNISLHPYFCIGLKGYFFAVARMVTNSEVQIQETKCTFKGDDYHEFLIKW